jgi:hypothetical protein
MGIPLCDDVWLGMQAQHIAAVEIGIIRPLELHSGRRGGSKIDHAGMRGGPGGSRQMGGGAHVGDEISVLTVRKVISFPAFRDWPHCPVQC